jgi:hypothetical protein
MSTFHLLYKDRYKWHKGQIPYSLKKEAEREAFRKVHEEETTCVLILESQPVVVSRIDRADGGVAMTHPNRIYKEDAP